MEKEILEKEIRKKLKQMGNDCRLRNALEHALGGDFAVISVEHGPKRLAREVMKLLNKENRDD